MHIIQLLLTALATVPATSLDLSLQHCNRRSALLGVGAAALAPISPARSATVTTLTAPPTAIPTWRLAGGVDFPILSLNTAGLTADAAELAFRNALAAGISHVEFHPGIERDGVARVLPSVPRQSVFLTTKVATGWERNPTPAAAVASIRQRLDADLAVLGTDYFDMLMLRESPDRAVMQAMWAEMENVRAEGKARSLGVINYCESALACILATAKEPPSVNYFQMHAGMGPDPSGLRAYGESRGIRTFAYGHLGEKALPQDDTDELLASPLLRRIGGAHGKTAEEVALRWILQSGAAASVRPSSDFILGRSYCEPTGSACADGLLASAGTFGWKLSAGEMGEIDAMKSPVGYPTLFSSPGCYASFFSKK